MNTIEDDTAQMHSTSTKRRGYMSDKRRDDVAVRLIYLAGLGMVLVAALVVKAVM